MVEDSEDGVIQPDALLLYEGEDGRSSQRLGDAGQAEKRLGTHGHAVLQRGEPVTACHGELAVLGHRQAGTGDAMPRYELDDGLVDRLKARTRLAGDWCLPLGCAARVARR